MSPTSSSPFDGSPYGDPSRSHSAWIDMGSDVPPTAIYGVPVLAELPPAEVRVIGPAPRRRKVLLPLLLFVATCLSTWYAGTWMFARVVPGSKDVLLRNPAWSAPVYMLAIMSFLGAHEMGHFVQSLRYRVRASFPLFIPFPISPIGTMGAVIVTAGRNRNRRELFDIGLTGPLAGLVVAIPLVYYGIVTADVIFPEQIQQARAEVKAGGNQPSEFAFPSCLLAQFMADWIRPDLQGSEALVLSPWLLAGWAAMLVTGLNMVPISQLDGGHVAYALFGRRAHWLARAAVLAAVIYMFASRDFGWSLMLVLVLLMRPDHPPTLNDAQPLGRGRTILGLLSLSIPVFCLSPLPIIH